MPSFFTFQQGNESRTNLLTQETSPLLGRFRAVPVDTARRVRHRNSLTFLSSVYGYGSIFGAPGEDGDERDYNRDEDSDDEDDGSLRRWVLWLGRTLRDLWIEPRQSVVARSMDKWWTRWTLLMVWPAIFVSFPLFCIIVFTLCGHMF